jgi:beta-glucanase (GH16 family)
MNTHRVLALLGLLAAVESGCSGSDLSGHPMSTGGAGAGGRAGTSLGSAGNAASSAAGGGAGGSVAFQSAGASGSADSAAGESNGGSTGTIDPMLPPPGWTLAWSDEFNGAKGDMLDQSKWSYSVGPNNANKEQEFYTDRPENSGMDGEGHFLITALHEDYMGYQYTSAKFTSSGNYEPKYGRLEARIKLPSGKGLWPAFWNLGTNIGDVGWPNCGEMDIMETVGDELTTNHGSLHGPGYSGGSPLTGTFTLPNGALFSDDFHVFAAEWEENVVRFYVDSNLYETKTPDDVPPGKTWVYDHSVFMILNVAVGGTWPGNPDNSIFPSSMAIDYVRVYERTAP